MTATAVERTTSPKAPPVARTEESPAYVARPADPPAMTGPELVAAALAWLAGTMRQPGAAMESPDAVRKYLTLSLTQLEHEVFGALFLDAQHRVIADEPLFRGTVTQASVYPREVVKAALHHNAAAVILYHNHPSGVTEPSRADEYLTQTLKSALSLVDVRILDHIIVAGVSTMSFAERGLL